MTSVSSGRKPVTQNSIPTTQISTHVTQNPAPVIPASAGIQLNRAKLEPVAFSRFLRLTAAFTPMQRRSQRLAPPGPRQRNRSVPALATVLAFGIADCRLKAALKLPVRRHFLAAGP
jgi:hypothetical protein